ncbi:MAG: flagellar protein FlgN [Clostridiales bacterium]|jgi:flagellar biosynthesis/type III secretory pathway chaperone|nr:flagellar protein FlgN [Clostridiales bacterium]
MNNALINVLDSEYEIVIKLIEFAGEKTNAFLSEDINAINEILETESGLEKKLGVLEIKRGSIIKEIQALQGSSEPIGISDIISRADEPYKTRLNELKAKTDKALRELKRINDINGELICLNLNYINFMINSVFSGKHVTYGTTGNTNASGATSIFDNRA